MEAPDRLSELEGTFGVVASLSPSKHTPTKVKNLQEQYGAHVGICKLAEMVGDEPATSHVADVIDRVLKPHCHCQACLKCRLASEAMSSRLWMVETELELMRASRCYRELAQVSVNKFKRYIFGNAWPTNQGFLKVVSALLEQPIGDMEQPSRREVVAMKINQSHRQLFRQLKDKLSASGISVSEYAQAIQGANHQGNEETRRMPGRMLKTWANKGREEMWHHLSCLVYEEEAIDAESLWLAIDGFVWWTNGGPEAPDLSPASTSSSSTSPSVSTLATGDASASVPKRRKT